MARTQVGGIRTSTSAASSEVENDPALSAPPPGVYKHVFQSRKAALVLSLKRRKIHYMPDGTREEEIPYTKADNRLDMVKFSDHFLRTDDDEIAAAIKALPSEVFGVGALCWDYNEQAQAQRVARAAEIRAQLAADPSLADVLKLTPSDAKDWNVKPKAAPAADKELSEEELDALTRPSK